MKHAVENLKTGASHLKEDFLKKLLKVIDVDLVYHSPGLEASILVTILITNECRTISPELIDAVRKAFERFPGNFRIYQTSYAREELEKGNLYFVRNCLLGQLLYKSSQSEELLLAEDVDAFILLGRTQVLFNKELDKIRYIKEGVYYHKKRKHWPHAAFLLHQTIELLYRCMEYFAMGKPLISHRVADHLNYAHPFIHGAGRLFSKTARIDQQLLEILDRAYSESRYSNDFDITKKEVRKLLDRAETMEQQVQEIFQFRMSDCFKFLKDKEQIITEVMDQEVDFTSGKYLGDKEDLDLVRNIILKELKTLKIYCFGERKGIQERQNISEAALLKSFHHYDLLIITEKNAQIYPNQISQVIYEKTAGKIATTIIITSVAKVELALKKGNRFLNRICQAAKEIYADPDFSLTFSRSQTSQKETLLNLKKDFFLREHRSSCFLEAAGKMAGEDDATEVSLQYMAIQQICLGVLYVVLGFRPDCLKIEYLLDLCSNFSDAPVDCFPQKSENDKRLFKMLTGSLNEVQFRTSNKRSFVDVDLLFNRSETFHRDMKAIAEKKIKEIEDQVNLAEGAGNRLC